MVYKVYLNKTVLKGEKKAMKTLSLALDKLNRLMCLLSYGSLVFLSFLLTTLLQSRSPGSFKPSIILCHRNPFWVGSQEMQQTQSQTKEGKIYWNLGPQNILISTSKKCKHPILMFLSHQRAIVSFSPSCFPTSRLT